MDVSIIIVNYNTKKLMLECLASIKQSKPKKDYEVIVIDNGSTDGSLVELRKIKEITLIENQDNLGFAKANNQGIEVAKGKYIFLLNSDTKVKDKAIDRLVEFAEETPEAGAVAARLLNPDGSLQGSVTRLPTLWRAVKHYWLGGPKLLDKYAPETKEPVVVEAAVMAAFLITPQALEKVGKLDERYFFYFEDLDYCRQLQRVGLKIYYLPQAEVIHYHGASGKHLADFANQWRRLKPSSKIYHGWLGHLLMFFILWPEQRIRRTFKRGSVCY